MLVLRTVSMSICVVVLLCVHASALPTMTDYRDHASVAAPVLSTGITTSYSIPENAQPASWAFVDAGDAACKAANISACFAQLDNFAYPVITQNNNAKTLPAVPGAVFMAIIGFMCVSLVRDRRVWLSVCVGIIVFSQAGVKTLPKLTARLARGRLCNEQASAVVAVNSLHVDDSFNWLSDQPDRQYIALLHRLAASPDHDYAFTAIIPGPRRLNLPPGLSDPAGLYVRQGTISSPPIMPVHASSNLLAGRFLEQIASYSCFSPAFIFSNLARGPPLPA